MIDWRGKWNLEIPNENAFGLGIGPAPAVEKSATRNTRFYFYRNWKKETRSSKPSLMVAVFKTFWKEYALLTTICAINDVVLRIGQPLLLGQLLLYFR